MQNGGKSCNLGILLTHKYIGDRLNIGDDDFASCVNVNEDIANTIKSKLEL